MSLLAHATLSAPGLDAEKRALAAQSQHECREAARIQAQTGCTRTEALRLAAEPIPSPLPNASSAMKSTSGACARLASDQPPPHTILTLDQIAALASAPIAPVYLCPVCCRHHPSHDAAAQCAASSEKPLAQAGDLVVIGSGFQWRDGLDDWLFDGKGYEFHSKKTLRFWYVITAVTQYPGRRAPGPEGDRSLHQLVYHMRTLGLFNGQEGGHSGWTRMRSHIPWTKGDRPPPQSVIDEAAKHVGKIFDNLL